MAMSPTAGDRVLRESFSPISCKRFLPTQFFFCSDTHLSFQQALDVPSFLTRNDDLVYMAHLSLTRLFTIFLMSVELSSFALSAYYSDVLWSTLGPYALCLCPTLVRILLFYSISTKSNFSIIISGGVLRVRLYLG